MSPSRSRRRLFYPTPPHRWHKMGAPAGNEDADAMPGREMDVIVVPYDVERDDTPGARGARELVSRGLLAEVERRGLGVHVSEIPLRRPGAGKAEVVAAIGRTVARAVALAHSQRRFPPVVSGGCLVAVGVVTGLQRTGRELRAASVDAHRDFNTPASTPTGS